MQGKDRKNSFTYELLPEQQELLLGIMVSGNFKRRETPYSIMSVEGEGFIATLYEKEKHGKRKLLIQGSKAEDFVLFQLEPVVLGAATLGYEKILSPELFSPHAGSDESGKGDFFGPLVVAAVYTDEKLSDRMIELGVKDCKQLTDKAIVEMTPQLREILTVQNISVVKLSPPAYNRLYAKMRNVNRMLAWAHATAIEGLLEKQPNCKRVVIDQFAHTEETISRALKPLARQITVQQRHKAESDIAVAAASIIARDEFIRDTLEVPRGSSDPKVAQFAVDKVSQFGPVWLMNNAKAHFQTADKVLSECNLTREALPEEGRIKSSSLTQLKNKK
jgi:ribonuclease HIII